MTKIRKDYIRDLAEAAKLELSDEQVDVIQDDLKTLDEYSQLLAQVDTNGCQPTYHGNNKRATLRQDVAQATATREEVFSNIPEQEEQDYIVVPAMISDGEA